VIDEKSVDEGVNNILRFLASKSMIRLPITGEYISEVIEEDRMISLKCKKAGILKRYIEVGQSV